MVAVLLSLFATLVAAGGPLPALTSDEFHGVINSELPGAAREGTSVRIPSRGRGSRDDMRRAVALAGKLC